MSLRQNILTKSLLWPNRYLFFLILLICLVILSNFIWLKTNKPPPRGNDLQDLLPGINFYLDIINTKLTFSYIFSIFKSPSLLTSILSHSFKYIRDAFFIYPPLAPVSYSMFYLLFGPHAKMEPMVNSLYLAIALCSVYGIGKKIFNEKTGLLAAFIFSSFPGIISVSRYVYSEFIMMCLVVLTLYVLLMTNYFRSRKYSLLLGVCLGLAALTKWEFPLSLIGPLVLTLRVANNLAKEESPNQKQKRLYRINLLFSISLGILISLIWYAVGFKDAIWRLFFRPDENIFINSATTFYQRVFSIHTLTYYLLTIINVHIRFFYFLCLVLLALVFLYRIIGKRYSLVLSKNNIFYLYFFILWIIITYACLTLVKIHAPSHIMVILPAFAIIIASGITSLKNKVAESALICSIILYGLFSHLHSFIYFEKLEPFYNFKVCLTPIGKLILTSSPGLYMRDNWEAMSLYPPDNREWKIRHALNFIRVDSFKKMINKPVVLVLGAESNINCFSFTYYNLLGKYQLYIEPRGNDRSGFPKDRSRFDYIVLITQEEKIDDVTLSAIIQSTPNKPKEYKWVEFRNAFFEKYKLIKEYYLSYPWRYKIYKLTDIRM